MDLKQQQFSDCLTSNPLEIFGYKSTDFNNITGRLTAVFKDPSVSS